MELDNFLLNVDTNTKNANMVKDMILDRLHTDGLITQEQAAEYMEKWQVIIIQAGWFKKWMNAFNKKKDDFYFKLVKFED